MKLPTFIFTIHRRAPAIRMADELDGIELYCTEQTFVAAAPLIMRLRTRTLGRRGYHKLVAIFVANSLVSGQIEETDITLRVVAKHWKFCPLRYLPVIPLPRSILQWL